jgi:hypothetical protein
MIMEPISEVLGTLVSELIDRENGAGRKDRAVQLEMTALDAALPGFDFEPILTAGCSTDR